MLLVRRIASAGRQTTQPRCLSRVRELPVLGPEDVVLQKLRWFVTGGEVWERQWRDIVSVLRTTGTDLDDAYLDSVAGPAGFALLLERALARGGFSAFGDATQPTGLNVTLPPSVATLTRSSR
jgi:hypothetical protein